MWGGEIEHRFRRCFYCCCRQHGLLFVKYVCIIFILCIINVLLCKGYFNYSYIKSHYGLQGVRAPLPPLPSPPIPSLLPRGRGMGKGEGRGGGKGREEYGRQNLVT